MKKRWYSSDGPIYCLAPMIGVTDTAFRQLILETGRPTVFFTELFGADYVETNCRSLSDWLKDAQKLMTSKLNHIPQGFPLGRLSRYIDYLEDKIKYSKKEKPLVAQIWGIHPESVFSLAKLVKERGFDGVDLNMGCPDPKVIGLGGCTALMKNRKLAKDLITATRRAVGKDFPVSVKTRIGFQKIETNSWISFLLHQDIDVLTVHCRTVADMSLVPNRWAEIKKVVDLKNRINKNIKIIGNGDVKSLREAELLVKKYNLDGIMIGRGVFENPWIFNPKFKIKKVSSEQLLALGLRHIELFEKTWGDKNFHLLKRFLKNYVRKEKNAEQILLKIDRTNSIAEAKRILKHS